ncbi:MAG: glycosyltransferase family 87 protein [Bacteroidales bacterium]
MIKIKKYKIRFPGFGWILTLFFILFFVIQLKNNRFELNDFKVYYLGMQNFLKGDVIYGIPFGLDSGFYKYSPFALLPFTVFYYMPYLIAAVLFYFLVAAAIGITLYKIYHLLLQVFNFKDVKQNKVLYFTTLILLNHFYRELHLGNVNMLLLLLYMLSLGEIYKNKQYTAGILIGIGLLFKLHFIVLLPVLLLFRKFKASATVLITFVAGLLLPVLFIGFEANNALLKAWLEAMKGHNSNISMSSDTIYAWINKLLTVFGMQQQGILYSLLILISIGFFFLWIILKEKHKLAMHSEIQRFTFVYLLAIAFIPIITVTDSEHFLFSLPIVMFSLFLLFSKRYIAVWKKAVIILAYVMYGGNWHDLWGHSISVFFTQNGILGLGNILLIGMLVWIVYGGNDPQKERMAK